MAFRLVVAGVALFVLAAAGALWVAIGDRSLGIGGLALVLLPSAILVAWILRVDDVAGSTPLDRHA